VLRKDYRQLEDGGGRKHRRRIEEVVGTHAGLMKEIADMKEGNRALKGAS